MTSLPPCLFFINQDISFPLDHKPFIGSIITRPGSSAGPSTLTQLVSQLFINDVMTEEEFDSRIVADPNYPLIVRLQGLRILVIVPSYICDGYLNLTFDHYRHFDGYHRHRHEADVIMFFHQGMIDVECNRLAWPKYGSPCNSSCDNFDDGYGRHHHRRDVRIGPPGQCYDAQRINMYELIRAGKKESHGCCDIQIPWDAFRCNECSWPFWCDKCHSSSGMRICRGCCGECRCGCGTSLIDNQGIRSSPVHLPNFDAEVRNPAFIYRK